MEIRSNFQPCSIPTKKVPNVLQQIYGNPRGLKFFLYCAHYNIHELHTSSGIFIEIRDGHYIKDGFVTTLLFVILDFE